MARDGEILLPISSGLARDFKVVIISARTAEATANEGRMVDIGEIS